MPISTNPADRHIALLIDADNISHTKIAGILSELSKYGTPNIRRAYGDWTSKQLSGWQSHQGEQDGKTAHCNRLPLTSVRVERSRDTGVKGPD